MKKFYVLVVGLLVVSGAIAQSAQPFSTCLPEGITFSTQAQIDNFQTNYPNCMEIEGNVTINGSNITNLNGLNVVTSIGGDLNIGYNAALTSLTGLEGLTSIGDYLHIYYNYALTSLTGLDNLTSIGGLEVGWNHALTSLTGLDNLTSIGGYLKIYNNAALTSLTGLEGLTSIGGDLHFEGNNALTSLTVLDNLTSIGGTLEIWGNHALTNLTGLENLTSIGGDLFINGNGALTSLTGLEGLTSIEGVLGIIYTNVLTSLTGLEGLTSIGSDLWIDYTDALTNLTGLEGLTSIGGDLRIGFNAALTNLTGLDNLNFIGSDLVIYQNTALTNLTGLEGLTSIGGDLHFRGNNALTNLSGLNNINIELIGDLSIIENNSLSTCNEQIICDYLASPNGSVNIYKNATGCNSPIEVANACGITLPCLPFGNYYFFSQADIDNFQTAFPNCTALQGNITINGSDITNLLGLDSLTSIGGDLFISGNDALTSLAGLEGLASIGGRLMIGDGDYGGNASLTSLTGLDNVAPSSITYLFIKYNPSLSHCAVQSICDYLASPNGVIQIFNNATGCNSQYEVEAACGVGINDQPSTSNYLNIYPNPASNQITIETPIAPNKNTFLTIYNINGQQLLTRQITEQQTVVDVSGLSQGVYFVRVVDDDGVSVGKVVKR